MNLKTMLYLNYNMKILITGGTGLVGNGLKSVCDEYKDHQFIFSSSKDCDLKNYEKSELFFEIIKPDYIIHCAANVGGLYKNMNYKVEMLEDNLIMNYNILKLSHKYKVKKLICILSTCIFPDKTSYPIDETMLHNGPPHFSNDAYAYAKRLMEIHVNAYNQQYDTNFVCVIPTNIYGKHDNFSIEDGHVLPALIHKCYLSKQNNEDFVILGTGKPLRQFIYNVDLARLIMFVLEEYENKKPIILSVDEKDEKSIKEVGTIIAKEFDYTHKIKFDSNFSDGQYKKTASNKLLRSYLPNFEYTNIENGLKETIDWFKSNYENARK